MPNLSRLKYFKATFKERGGGDMQDINGYILQICMQDINGLFPSVE